MFSRSPADFEFCVPGLRASGLLLGGFGCAVFVVGVASGVSNIDKAPILLATNLVLLVFTAALTFRWSRINVAVSDRDVEIRNIWSTRTVLIEDAERFAEGFSGGVLPGSEYAGSLMLKDGREISVLALSGRSLFAANTRSSVSEAIERLNSFVRDAQEAEPGRIA